MCSFMEMLGLELIRLTTEPDLNLKKIQACIDLDVDVNYADILGYTASHRAARRGHEEVIRLLAATGRVDFSLRTITEITVAKIAVIVQSVPIVEILAKHICSWNIPDQVGDTPIMDAIKLPNGNAEILKILLECPQVDPNIKDRYGDTPVMMALKEEKVALARMLIQCPRVDLRSKDRNGSSLLKVAR